jgi:hypothetical protein
MIFGTAFAVQAGSKDDDEGGGFRVGPLGQAMGGPAAWRGARPDVYARGNDGYGYGAYGYGGYGAFAGPPRYPTSDRCRLGWSERPEQLIQDQFFLENNGTIC